MPSRQESNLIRNSRNYIKETISKSSAKKELNQSNSSFRQKSADGSTRKLNSTERSFLMNTSNSSKKEFDRSNTPSRQGSFIGSNKKLNATDRSLMLKNRDVESSRISESSPKKRYGEHLRKELDMIYKKDISKAGNFKENSMRHGAIAKRFLDSKQEIQPEGNPKAKDNYQMLFEIKPDDDEEVY